MVPMQSRQTKLAIREFAAGDEIAFRRLNEEWILRHFAMESKDEAVLADPQGAILNRGGRIFFAVQDGAMVGCCALMAMHPGEFEVAKMAVTEASRGTGVGRALLARAIEEARASGARRLYLETNRRLTPAIRLYESMGFQHLPPERVTPSEYSRANVFMELELRGAA